MYYPLQIPSILDKKFIQNVQYKEYHNNLLKEYIMCIWTMESYDSLIEPVNNVILPDGCIDLIIDFSQKEIFFAGNSKATLNFPLTGKIDFMGIRMKPGIFYNIYKVDCNKIMDTCIPYSEVELDKHNLTSIFSSSNLEERLIHLINYFKEKTYEMKPDEFIEMINTITEKEDLKLVSELATKLNYSERQLNRIFKKHCGVSLKVFLNIVRLHKSLHLMIYKESNKLITLAGEAGFYDESHFIKEIKKYCGVSPTDIIKIYNMS